MKKCVAIYMRSSLEQDEDLRNVSNPDESDTIANQRKYLYEKVQAKGYSASHIKEYIDDGHTGTNFKRPGFQQLIEDVEAGKIEAVFVKDFSRMGRDYIGVGEYMEQFFPLHNVRVISINDNWDSDEHKGETLELDASFRTIIYEMYSRDLSIKRKSANQARNKKGTFIGAYVPYGYKKIPGDAHSIVIDNPCAEVVRRIFDLFISGEKMGNIAKILTDEGVPTPAMSKGDSHCYDNVVKEKEIWDTRAIGLILKNEMYTGTLILNRWSIKGFKADSCVENDPSEWLKFQDNHDVIISREIFEAAGKRLPNRRKSTEQGKKKVYPVYCGHCGRKLKITTRNEGTFTCPHGIEIPADPCGQIEIRREKLEEILLKAINTQAATILRSHKSNAANEKKIRAVQKELDILAAEQAEYHDKRLALYKRFKAGKIEKDDFFKKKEVLLRDEEESIAEAEALQEKLVKMQEEQSFYDENKDMIKTYSLLSEYDQELVARLISKVEVFNDGHIRIRWSSKDEFRTAEELKMMGDCWMCKDNPAKEPEKNTIAIYTSDMFLMPQDDDMDSGCVKNALISYATKKLDVKPENVLSFYDSKEDLSLFFREGYMKFIETGRSGAAGVLLIRSFKDLYLSNQQMNDLMFWILPKLSCRLIAVDDGFDSSVASDEEFREMYEKYKGVRNGDLTKYRAMEREKGLRKGKQVIYCTRLYGYRNEEDGCHAVPEILEVVKKVFQLSKENHDLKQAVIWLNQEEIPTCKAFYISQGYEYAPEANPKWNKEKVWGVIKQEGYVEPCRHYEKCMELGRHCDRRPVIDRETFEEVNETCRYRNR